MIRGMRLGVSVTPEDIRLSLVSRQLKRFQIRDVLTLSTWRERELPELKKDVTAFLKKNKAVECPAILSIPRRQTVMRQLTLPADAHSNLAKVVEYQLMNLLPAEDVAFVYDFSVSKTAKSAGGLSVTVFLAMRSVLDNDLQICDSLGIKVMRVVPSGVALANASALLSEHFKTKTALFVQRDGQGQEVSGISNQRLVVWRESPLHEGEPLLDFLRTEVELFRSQASLTEDMPLDVFVSGNLESSDAQETEPLKIKCHILSRPQAMGLGVGSSVINSRQMQEHVTSLAAGISGLKRRIPEPVNLIPPERRVQQTSLQQVLTYALLAINCVLILVLTFRERVQDSRYSRRLDQEIARLEPEVRKVRYVEDQLAQLAKRADLLADFKELNPEALQALTELSQILPKHTVVSDLNFKEGTIQISGLSGEAAALPQIIDNSPLFREAEFVAAITRSSVAPDKEGYRISLKLESALKRQPNSLVLPTAVQPAPDSAREKKP